MPPSKTNAGSNPEIEAETNSAEQAGNFAVLRIPSFAWFLTGATLSNAAQWIQQVTVSWLVYDLTTSGTMLGTLSLVRSVATLGLVPFAGIAIDRFSRRGLLYASSIWLFAISFGFGLVLLGNPDIVWPLFLFSFLTGIGQAMSMPLRQTVIFSVAPRSLTPSAVALVQTGWAVMRSIGPAVGGFLILLYGPAGNFFIQAGAYALVALTIMKLQLPYERRDIEKVKSRGSFREGWGHIAANPTTRAFLLMSCVLPLFIIPNFSVLPPIYAKDIFAGGPDTLGLLLSAVGVGGIAGGVVTNSLSQQERRGLIELGALLLLSLSLIAFAVSTALWMALLFMALAGFFEMIFLTTNTTLLQLSIPDSLRGRVTGIVSLTSGLGLVGAFVAGFGSDLVGPRTMTVFLAGAAATVAVIVFLTSPVIREHRLSKALDATESEPTP